MVGIFLAVDLVIIASLVVLAFLSLSKGGYRVYINRLFSLFALAVAVWIPANHASNSFHLSEQVVLIANYLVFPCALAALVVLMLFLIELSGVKRGKKYISNILLPFVILVGALSPSPLLVVSIEQSNNVYAIQFGPLLPFYAAALVLPVVAIAYALYRGMTTLSGFRKERVRIVGIALTLCLPLIFVFLFVLPSATGYFGFTEFGISPLIVLAIGLYYSVVKHHLFDIRLAVVRSAAYFLSLLTLAGVYYIVAYLVSILVFQGEIGNRFSISPLNIMLALGLAFIFLPIKQFFDKVTDKIFYRQRYNVDDFIARLGGVLATTTDLRALLKGAAREISTTLKASQAFFFVQYNHTHHMLAGTARRSTSLPPHDVEVLNDFFAHSQPDVLVADLLESDHPLRRLLVSHRVAIIMPLVSGTRLVGYLCLGEQQGSGYTNRDIKTLRTVADSLVIAMQNALSIKEVKDINESLEQRVHAAIKELQTSNARLKRLDTTKDEFLSMASHQLRTPLTSVKGYLSMVLEGDLGKVPKAQQQVLEEAFISSERMVHLIHDFLNVSRLQTGKFTLELADYDLSRLVREEVKSLERVAETRDIRLVLKDTLGVRHMSLDNTKVRQVVMNFIDNAIYYSPASSSITITLTPRKDRVVFTVKDRGIGVPEAEQAQLFGKFYRATNARRQRPDGTGVGLFLSKKIITAHGGDVLFESKEGKGSTFGFWLPLADDKPH